MLVMKLDLDPELLLPQDAIISANGVRLAKGVEYEIRDGILCFLKTIAIHTLEISFTPMATPVGDFTYRATLHGV
jgi:hypothetical protein